MERTKSKARRSFSAAALAFLAASLPIVSAQSCVSLAGSVQCVAFNSSSVSTDSTLVGLYPFLAFVTTTDEFDHQLDEYVKQDYVRSKYENILGCSNVTLTNTTDYYARYTTSVICNAIVQNSIKPCSLSSADSRPLCADSCALHATSEEEIVVNSQLCGTPGTNYISQIRADFVNCALPANSLSGSCVAAEENEPDTCGFSTNMQGLCGYCGTSSPNATDSCCVNSNVTSLCVGVTLPTITSMPPFLPSSTSSSTSAATGSSTGSAQSSNTKHGLSGGTIAGIVIGSTVALVLLLALLALLCISLRKRRGSQQGSVFNQPPPRRGPQQGMGYARDDHLAPGGRVARMAALEGEGNDEKGRREGDRSFLDPSSDSEHYAESPEPRAAPATGKRNGSLSSNSIFNGLGAEEHSPTDLNLQSSPGDVHSGQSEQLPFFKDYYSQDEIHPGDKVATLWAYQPRAADEFELERGDMLRVVGIWDDGWATGVRIDDRAEEYEGKHKVQRDSGVSHGTRRDSPTPQGDVKAFPLVCICLPEHWKKTVEGDSSTEATSPSNPGGQNPPFGGF